MKINIFLRNQFFSFLNNFEPTIEKYSNNFSGRCFIIGNGPSINEQNLTLLTDEFSFVSNRFVLHPHFDNLKPNFYCISDPDFLIKREQNILLNVKEKMMNITTHYSSHKN